MVFPPINMDQAKPLRSPLIATELHYMAQDCALLFGAVGIISNDRRPKIERKPPTAGKAHVAR